MDGEIGTVTSVVTRALMNRMVPIATLLKTEQRTALTPMVVSGTHSLDLCLWLMEGKEPVEVYARSIDPVLSEWGTKDATFGLFTMDDGTLWSMNISWALPEVWPGAVYGLEIGIIGTEGVIDIEDTHRDVILASPRPQGAGYTTKGFRPSATRHVDFIGSYPPGDVAGGCWGLDARGNDDRVQPVAHRTPDTARHRLRRAPQPVADHGDGSLGATGRTGEASRRSRRAE